MKVAEGRLPAAWITKNTANLWMVNYDYLDLGVKSARNGISSWTKIDDTTLRITTVGDFVANKGERVCLAVKLIADSTLTDGDDDNDDLYVVTVAKDFFPEKNGVININGIDYVYQRLIYEQDYNRVKLENISAAGMPNAGPAPHVSPRTWLLLPTLSSCHPVIISSSPRPPRIR